MGHGTKIATCSYCGTRAALVLRGEGRHELSCASCGAPLHEMKMLRTEDVGGTPRRPQPPAKPRGATPLPVWERPAHPDARKRKKKRKGFARRVLEEIFDEIEDLFD